MNILILDTSDAKEGDTLTLTVNKVIPSDNGFIAEVSTGEAEAEETEEPESMMGEGKMSPMAKSVLGK